ncbi:MAG: SMC-Scp complex subunit ScpB [Ignavibacteriales bacterium]|nr:SMC-Scp complex subunit ScpB [Ignavibacteriales bacterium]
MEQQTTISERQALNMPSTVKSLIEALIFAAGEPLTVRQIKAIYEEQTAVGEERRLEQAEIQQIIGDLNQEYQKADKPYRIIAIAGGFQFATLKQYAEWIGRLSREQSRRKLSQSSLESLAIIAYKQPVSKPEIEAIRGVNCDYVLKTLLEKELVTIVGRAETVGRPLLYGTTREFLKHFGLNEITDLPRPREIEEILGETQFETERRMLEAAAAAEHMKEEEDFKSRLPHIPKKKPELSEEVHIVPKSPRRNIVLKQGGESEQAGREPIELPVQTKAVESAAPVVDESPESVTSETGVGERSAAVEVPEPLTIPEMEMMEGQATTPANRIDHSADEGKQIATANDSPLATEASSTDVPEHSPQSIDSSQEPELTQPRKSRWTSWKEKIQSFIRKLFV